MGELISSIRQIDAIQVCKYLGISPSKFSIVVQKSYPQGPLGSKSSCPETTMGVASLSLDSKPGSSQMSRHRPHPHHQITSGGSSATTPSGLPPYLQNHRYTSIMTDSPDAAAMSPGLSSVATSTTSGDIEVSLWKQFTCVK